MYLVTFHHWQFPVTFPRQVKCESSGGLTWTDVAAQTHSQRPRVKRLCQTDPESGDAARISFILQGFSAQITKALPRLFCKKHVKSTLIQTPCPWTSKCLGTFFRGLGAVEHIQRSGSRSPVKLRGQSTSLIVCWKSLPKATEHKRRVDYPLVERKWNSSDKALKQVWAAVWVAERKMSDTTCSLISFKDSFNQPQKTRWTQSVVTTAAPSCC